MKIIKVKNIEEGEKTVKDFLYENCDLSTVIFLSGGKTPKSLYEQILLENKLKAGAFGMTDERFGKVGHENSNALIMKYFSPFYPILKGKEIEKSTEEYDETVRYLLNYFKKSIFLAGIGADGHTVGIPSISDISVQILEEKSDLVSSYDAKDDFYHERITLNFNAISQMDTILISVFGKEKRKALKKMFEDGPVEEIPARFYLRPQITSKTILITDQKV